MSLMKFFSGPTAEKLEARGDIFSAAGQWGQAKQVYERALHKREKTEPPDGRHCRALQEKLRQAQEALAREHYQTARDYHDGGYAEEARETLQLALEMSRDPAFRETLTREIADLNGRPESNAAAAPASAAAPIPHEVEAPTSGHTVSEEEYFQALCHTLPEDVGRAYQSYGEDFVTGYVALNTGDFPTAITHLERALAEGLQWAIDGVAASSAIQADELFASSRDVTVTGLNSSADYQACLAYLQGVAVVDGVTVRSARPGEVTFGLALNALPQYLLESLERDGLLEPSADGSSWTYGGAAR